MTDPTTIHIVPKTTPHGEIDLMALLKKYLLSKWYWYVLCAGVGGYLAHHQLKSVAPVYEIKGRILIKENKGVASSAEDILVEKLYLVSRSKSLDNEIEILKSHSLMEDVVKTLHLDIEYIWPAYLSGRQRYGKFPIYIDTFALASDTLYKKNFYIEPMDSVSFAFKTDTVIGVYHLNEPFSNAYGTFRVREKDPMPLDKKYDLEFQFLPSANVADKYMKKLKVGSGDHASMLDLKIEDEVPQRGIDILNTLVDRYNFTTVADKNQLAEAALKFVDERLKEIVKDLKGIESGIENYKKRNEIVTEVGGDVNIVTNEVQRIKKVQSNLSIQQIIFENMLKQLDTRLDTFQLVPTNLSHINANLMSLLDQYNEKVLSRQQLLKTAQLKNPLVISITEDIKTLRASIFMTLTNYANDVKIKIQTLDQEMKGLETKLQSVPTKERGLLEAKRQQNLKENLYIYLLRKREEIALALVANGANCRIIDVPRSSTSPISPNPPIFYIGGVFTGIFLPLLVIIGRDVFKTTIDSVGEIKNITGEIPIIGQIPKNKGQLNAYQLTERRGSFALPKVLANIGWNWKTRFTKVKNRLALVIKPKPTDLLTEAFLLARTNLMSATSDACQTILITSSKQREGKTFVAINLAMSFAITNKKTLLLDLDLRNPSIQTDLQLKNTPTIKDYLTGNCALEELIHEFEEEPNLHILSNGKESLHAPKWLTHPNIDTFFELLKKRYEVIIIDSPPVGLVADAFLLNAYINQTIYVVRQGKSTTSNIKNANKLFTQQKLIHPSILFNYMREV